MRRVALVLGLSGLLAASFVSRCAFADEPLDAPARQPAIDASAEETASVEVAGAVAAPTAAAVAPAATPKVGDLSVHGYFRGGFGASNQKGRMTCFKLALEGGLLSKYRLGNECEVWGELALTAVVYAGDDGSVASLHFMPVAFIPTTYIGYSPTGVTSSDQGSPGTGATVAFPDLYADIKGIPWLFGGTAWGGTRYYKRESIYISDFFYWNPSGVGAGIEDVDLGSILPPSPALRELRLSYAAFAVDGQPTGSPLLPMQSDFGVRNDVQLRGLRPYETGEIQLGFQYILDWSNNKDANGNSVTHGGWGLTVQLVQQLLGGTNKLAVQYGTGGGTGFGTLSRFYYPDFSLYQPATESRRRIVDVLTIQPSDWFGTQVGLVWQHDDLGGGGTIQDWYSAGTRVSIAFTEHAKLLGEVGYDRVKKNNGAPVLSLAKFTVAPTIAASRGFWGRPELRLFYTWATWSQAAAGANVDSGMLYTAPDPITGAYKLSGSTFGLQTEAMW
jgi:maltoporin